MRPPWWVAAVGKAAAFTALVAGVFASAMAALAWWLAVVGILALRTFVSGNPVVARWDGWMVRIPAALRLIAGYVLCFVLAEALVKLLRGGLEWRTMTVTAAVSLLSFAACLIFWPQVMPGKRAPRPPDLLQRMLRRVGSAAPKVTPIILLIMATAARAHHCSFEPGCECLTDDGSLAALIAAGACMAQLQTLGSLAGPLVDPDLIKVAKAYWVYAAFSNNIYLDEQYKIPIPAEWKPYKQY